MRLMFLELHELEDSLWVHCVYMYLCRYIASDVSAHSRALPYITPTVPLGIMT